MITKIPLPAFAAALTAGFTTLCVPVAAQAQGTKCLPRAVLIKNLESKYNERMSGGGLQNATQLLEVWTSPKSGSFTVFITRADGVACIMATGQNWMAGTQTVAEGVKS